MENRRSHQNKGGRRVGRISFCEGGRKSSGRTTTVVAINMSHFDVVTMGPPKPILEVSEAFRSDTDALKLNLAVRSYRTEELKLYVLDVVKKAEKLMLEKGENVEYPPIEGLTAFNKITAELFLGTDHPVIQQKRAAPDGSFIVLHGCAHSPTGIDPTPQQWEKIADVIQEKNHIPFFDVSYQGLASGNLDIDAWSVLHLKSRSSCRKNWSFNVVCSSPDAAESCVVCNMDNET